MNRIASYICLCSEPKKNKNNILKNILQSGNIHQSIANRDNHHKGHETRWDTASEEMADLEISLAGLRDLGHDGS